MENKMDVNMRDVPVAGVLHTTSPYGVNRKTRRNWIYRLKKKRGAGFTKPLVPFNGLHGSKVLGTVAAIENLESMFRKIPVPENRKR